MNAIDCQNTSKFDLQKAHVFFEVTIFCVLRDLQKNRHTNFWESLRKFGKNLPVPTHMASSIQADNAGTKF